MQTETERAANLAAHTTQCGGVLTDCPPNSRKPVFRRDWHIFSERRDTCAATTREVASVYDMSDTHPASQCPNAGGNT